jgi:hypothetical protein
MRKLFILKAHMIPGLQEWVKKNYQLFFFNYQLDPLPSDIFGYLQTRNRIEAIHVRLILHWMYEWCYYCDSLVNCVEILFFFFFCNKDMQYHVLNLLHAPVGASMAGS